MKKKRKNIDLVFNKAIKNLENNISEVLLEARTGFEPVMTVLQTGALPLGDRAIAI